VAPRRDANFGIDRADRAVGAAGLAAHQRDKSLHLVLGVAHDGDDDLDVVGADVLRARRCAQKQAEQGSAECVFHASLLRRNVP
jgi:hypothetical protein